MTTTGTETVTPAQTQTTDVTSPIVTDGAQPVVSSPVVEGTDPTVVVPATEVTTTPSTSTTTATEEAPLVTPKWAQDRINELTAKRHAAERKAQQESERATAAEELLARVTSGQQPPTATATSTTTTATPPALTEQEVERRAQEKATQMARQSAFNNACNAVADAGAKEFKDTWATALSNLSMVGATGEGSNPDFLETAIELKSPEKVLHYLGTNLDQAQRIVSLPPKKMALEMARLEATLNAPVAALQPIVPPVSNAPQPIIPVGGAAKAPAGDITDPNMTPDDWFMLRAKQVAERKARYQRA